MVISSWFLIFSDTFVENLACVYYRIVLCTSLMLDRRIYLARPRDVPSCTGQDCNITRAVALFRNVVLLPRWPYRQIIPKNN